MNKREREIAKKPTCFIYTGWYCSAYESRRKLIIWINYLITKNYVRRVGFNSGDIHNPLSIWIVCHFVHTLLNTRLHILTAAAATITSTRTEKCGNCSKQFNFTLTIKMCLSTCIEVPHWQNEEMRHNIIYNIANLTTFVSGKKIVLCVALQIWIVSVCFHRFTNCVSWQPQKMSIWLNRRKRCSWWEKPNLIQHYFFSHIFSPSHDSRNRIASTSISYFNS